MPDTAGELEGRLIFGYGPIPIPLASQVSRDRQLVPSGTYCGIVTVLFRRFESCLGMSITVYAGNRRKSLMGMKGAGCVVTDLHILFHRVG